MPTPEEIHFERLRKVDELTGAITAASREQDWLAALRASVDAAAELRESQTWLVDSARAAGLTDMQIAEALRVTGGRVSQRFGPRAETARRLKEQLDALLRQEDD